MRKHHPDEMAIIELEAEMPRAQCYIDFDQLR